jgi:hypothetical protein
MRYQQPKLININARSGYGAGECWSGSTAIGDCLSGQSPGACVTGATASSRCNSGQTNTNNPNCSVGTIVSSGPCSTGTNAVNSSCGVGGTASSCSTGTNAN